MNNNKIPTMKPKIGYYTADSYAQPKPSHIRRIDGSEIGIFSDRVTNSGLVADKRKLISVHGGSKAGLVVNGGFANCFANLVFIQPPTGLGVTPTRYVEIKGDAAQVIIRDVLFGGKTKRWADVRIADGCHDVILTNLMTATGRKARVVVFGKGEVSADESVELLRLPKMLQWLPL